MRVDPSTKTDAQLYSQASLSQNPHILPISLLMLTVGLWYLQLTAC